MTRPLRLAVVGARGRAGAAVVRLALKRGMQLVLAVDRADMGCDVGPFAGVAPIGVRVAPTLDGLPVGACDAIVDFSTPALVPASVAAAVRCGASLVSGTTGLSSEAERALDEGSRHVPVLWEPNMSVGVHVLGRLLRQAIEALGEGVDVEIVEVHHGKKADAPSGTALRLAAIAKEALGGGELRHGREGRPGPRPASEIGIHAVRGGDVVGDHSIHLLALGERLEISHKATSRDLFARGALRAAGWMAGKPAGRYSLADVLGDRPT